MATADVVRTLLIVDMVGLALLALGYLWQRRMSRLQIFGWSVLALVVPVMGPFMVIASRPGMWDPNFSYKDRFRRLMRYTQRLLPTVPKMTRADRARLRKALGQPEHERKH
jgi:hypothetical protein